VQSVSLDEDTPVVTYGGSVLLNGSADNAQAGDAVTITERRAPATRGVSVRTVAIAHAAADGSFTARVRPVAHRVPGDRRRRRQQRRPRPGAPGGPRDARR